MVAEDDFHTEKHIKTSKNHQFEVASFGPCTKELYATIVNDLFVFTMYWTLTPDDINHDNKLIRCINTSIQCQQLFVVFL